MRMLMPNFDFVIPTMHIIISLFGRAFFCFGRDALRLSSPTRRGIVIFKAVAAGNFL